jgi:hypothetical protein
MTTLERRLEALEKRVARGELYPLRGVSVYPEAGEGPMARIVQGSASGFPMPSSLITSPCNAARLPPRGLTPSRAWTRRALVGHMEPYLCAVDEGRARETIEDGQLAGRLNS